MNSFVIVPFPVATWQQELYRLAYEKALADLATPRHHRVFAASWN